MHPLDIIILPGKRSCGQITQTSPLKILIKIFIFIRIVNHVCLTCYKMHSITIKCKEKAKQQNSYFRTLMNSVHFPLCSNEHTGGGKCTHLSICAIQSTIGRSKWPSVITRLTTLGPCAGLTVRRVGWPAWHWMSCKENHGSTCPFWFSQQYTYLLTEKSTKVAFSASIYKAVCLGSFDMETTLVFWPPVWALQPPSDHLCEHFSLLLTTCVNTSASYWPPVWTLQPPIDHLCEHFSLLLTTCVSTSASYWPPVWALQPPIDHLCEHFSLLLTTCVSTSASYWPPVSTSASYWALHRRSAQQCCHENLHSSMAQTGVCIK